MNGITIAIPTYNRGPILVETIERLLALDPRANEIVIVDQTPEHSAAIKERLETWSSGGQIRWERLEKPSVPGAMNHALRIATQPIVLFLDDDLIPDPSLAGEHLRAHGDGIWAVAGQVLQPGEEPQHFEESRLHRGALRDLEFPFRHDVAMDVENVMAGNLSVVREQALAIGGFDERFLYAAYRFESDFARRVIAAGGRIRFEPRAQMRHLKLPTGGVRSHGDPRRTAAPTHSAGDYLFAIKHVPAFWRYAARRFRQNVFTRYTVTHPIAIPMKAVAEIRGLILARRLAGRESFGRS
ncbi:MAG TPA: glycosyltransferase [Thermoanaerobaculia bacterium]|jgi:GT2 family glycosyltransferase|nr:glycosyltransferase [Thermoanaerobaculia bacterium]